MAIRLFLVHGSHPCAAVRRALDLKGLAYERVELPTTLQPLVMRPLFAARTVPGATFDGERVHGSRAIMRKADQLAPDPPLWPADPALRARVEEAETWGDQVLQVVARELIWPAFHGAPAAMASFQAGGRLPALPERAVAAAGPVVARVGMRLNATSPARARAVLAALPGHLDRVDVWIAEGVLARDDLISAADLQIGASLRELSAMADVRPLLAGRPADALGRRLFPVAPGEVPAGALPA